MKNYTFALPDEEAAALDANIELMIYAFPDMGREDALSALLRIGTEEVGKRLERMMTVKQRADAQTERPASHG